MAYILTFVNNLRESFLCWNEACGCEYFIVHSDGCVWGNMSGNKVHPTEEICQMWEPRPQQKGLHANKQWSAVQETAQEFAKSVNCSCSARHKTRLVWWFLHPFFSFIDPFFMFAICTSVKVFSPSFASFLLTIFYQEWMSMSQKGRVEESRITTHKHPAL